MLKKKDIVFMIAVLFVAGGMALFMQLEQGKAGETIRVRIDGNEYGLYPLAEDRVIEVDNEFGYNKIVLKSGEVSMEAADCPDRYCVEHKAIKNANQTIVCLPHKLVVEVIGKMEEEGIDSVAQ